MAEERLRSDLTSKEGRPWISLEARISNLKVAISDTSVRAVSTEILNMTVYPTCELPVG